MTLANWVFSIFVNVKIKSYQVLSNFLRLCSRYKFSKEDHLELIHLLWSVLHIPELDPLLLMKTASALISLLKFKDTLKPREDLTLGLVTNSIFFCLLFVKKNNGFAWRVNQWPLGWERLISSVSPSNSLISVLDPWRALDSPHALIPELQQNKDTVRCAALDSEVPGPHQEKLTTTLIVGLLKSTLLHRKVNRIELSKWPDLLTLEWRPLYNLYNQNVYSYKVTFPLVHLPR